MNFFICFEYYFRPFSKIILHIFFFMFSASFGVLLEFPKPSSLYRTKLFSVFLC